MGDAHDRITPGAAGARAWRAKAFTLVELMVVVGVIALIAGMLMPYFARVFEVARSTNCQHNLGQICQALHTSSNSSVTARGGSLSVVTGSSWVGKALAAASNAKEMLYCMDDNREHPANHELALETVLRDVYILQYHTSSTTSYDCSFLTDILAGKAVGDPQLWAIYPAGGRNDKPKGEYWPADMIPKVGPDQVFIGIDNDSAVMITFGSADITITPMDAPQHEYSRHWVMKGKGTPIHPLPNGKEPEDDDDKILCHLWGRNVTKPDPPYLLTIGAATSYGINKLVDPARWNPKQIYLMDANDTVIDLYKQGFDRIQDRHFKQSRNGVVQGRVNVATVDGGVSAWTKEELEREFRKEGGNRWDR